MTEYTYAQRGDFLDESIPRQRQVFLGGGRAVNDIRLRLPARVVWISSFATRYRCYLI